jgi:hypothetical protein
MSVDRRAFNRTVLGLLLAPAGARAQSPATSPHRTLYLSEGAARQEQLLAGARREGLVVIYTSLNTQDSTPLTTAFEKRAGHPQPIIGTLEASWRTTACPVAIS